MAGSGVVIRPASIAELAESMRVSSTIRMCGAGTQADWAPSSAAPTHSTSALNRIVFLEPADQVVEVESGMSFTALQEALAAHGQCLPYGPSTPTLNSASTIGGLISTNLPHTLEDQCGSWRDWVLGMTLVLADGTIAKCGSRAVKNVAGYDLHRFMVGTRGQLAAIASMILRTYPVRALPVEPLIEKLDGECVEIERGATTTIYRSKRTVGASVGWKITAGEPIPMDEPTERYFKRAKSIFDPEGKLS